MPELIAEEHIDLNSLDTRLPSVICEFLLPFYGGGIVLMAR
jgi:hypothetical protein